MKLKTKFEDEDEGFRPGEVLEVSFEYSVINGIKLKAEHPMGGVASYYYKTLMDLNEDWEDAPEEPKEYWTIDPMNEDYIDDGKYTAPDELERYEELGLRLNTKEEAELTVRKLKAWKRLKDKGFRFEGVKEDYIRFSHNQIPYRNGRRYLQFNKAEDEDWLKENWDDIKLLFFGGEE